MKIDLEKFICFMRNTFEETEVGMAIDDFLKQQGLEYKDGAIVERIEQKFKVGDVLADDYGIYIFDRFDEDDEKCFLCMGAYRYSQKVYENEHMLCSVEVHPATKEQRDTLFQKMKEAGYKWNAEELKLEKIEELSEFEKAVYDRIKDYDIEIYSNEQILEYSKVVAKELFEIANKQLESKNNS